MATALSPGGGGLPLTAPLPPSSDVSYSKTPVGAMFMSDCPGTSSLLLTHLLSLPGSIWTRSMLLFLGVIPGSCFCLAFLAGMTQIEVVGVGNLVASGTSRYPPEVTSSWSPGGSSSGRGSPAGPPGSAVAAKPLPSARDTPPFKAARCFPSLTVLMPSERHCQNQQSFLKGPFQRRVYQRRENAQRSSACHARVTQREWSGEGRKHGRKRAL